MRARNIRTAVWCAAGATAFCLLLGFGLDGPAAGLGLPGGPADLMQTPEVSICALQGDGFESPYAGETVRTRGVVYADLDETARRGFFLQAEGCDDQPATSDGLFVYLGVRGQVVAAGDQVEVTGLVQEYFGLTELKANPDEVVRLASGQPLPAPVDLGPPFDVHAVSEYYEALEGMSVGLEDGRVVGPTDAADQTWVVRQDLGIERVFQDDPRGTGEVICIDDGGSYEIAPEAKVGDRVRGLVGALDYTGGLYCLQPSAPPVVLPAAPSPEASSLPAIILNRAGSPIFSLATFNMADLFDTSDDPAVQDTILSAAEYQRRLEKRARAIHTALGEPEVLAVQEVENEAVLAALLARPEIEADYQSIWVDGPDERGIDTALLVRTDRVRVLVYETRQGCTALLDGLGPDGNRDMANPQNRITCDSDGDGVPDGNRLFSRPPLMVHLLACPRGCGSGEAETELWLVVNHWKSKVEDNNGIEYTLPRRIEEAAFAAALIDEIRSDPAANLILLGDLNDFPASQPLTILAGTGLQDTWARVEPARRYSYIYQGKSQVLDYILTAPRLPLSVMETVPAHVNADYPAAFAGVQAALQRSSDHDILLVRLGWLSHMVYFPIAIQP